MIAAMRHREPEVRRSVIIGLREIKDGRAVAPLIVALSDPAPIVRREAVITLAYLRLPESVSPLRNLLGDPDEGVRRVVVGALGYFVGPALLHDFSAALNDGDWRVRVEAAIVLGRSALSGASPGAPSSPGRSVLASAKREHCLARTTRRERDRARADRLHRERARRLEARCGACARRAQGASRGGCTARAHRRSGRRSAQGRNARCASNPPSIRRFGQGKTDEPHLIRTPARLAVCAPFRHRLPQQRALTQAR